MADIKAVIRAPFSITREDNAHHIEYHPNTMAQHFFPPFPSPTLTYSQYQTRGVHIRSHNDSHADGYDSHGVPLVPTVDSELVNAQAELARRNRLKNLRLQKGKLGVRLVREDCWRIGNEEEDWVEPEDTSRSNFDQAVPPFTRLMDATRDFLNSRHEEFQFARTKRCMDSIRNAFGLRGDYSPNHCKGSGEHGQDYVPPSALRYKAGAQTQQVALTDGPSLVEESCQLVRDPVVCVRGFLALVRRDAEAGWDIEPALKLAQILSAFIAFIHHYDVIPEQRAAVAASAQIARSAVRLLKEAKNLEEVLGNGTNLNRAMWAAKGGGWAGVERGGLEKEPNPVSAWEDEGDAGSDGGWVVETLLDHRPDAPTATAACASLQPYFQPFDIDSIRMQGYIPYSRRKIIKVMPPLAEAPDQPTFMRKLFRLVTVAAPWTVEEQWRARSTSAEFDDAENEAEADGDEPFVLEKEQATVEEPKQIVLWCEAEQFSGDLQSVVGVGLRGRWAMMGGPGAPQWWIFKAKDYVLPAFWQA